MNLRNKTDSASSVHLLELEKLLRELLVLNISTTCFNEHEEIWYTITTIDPVNELMGIAKELVNNCCHRTANNALCIHNHRFLVSSKGTRLAHDIISECMHAMLQLRIFPRAYVGLSLLRQLLAVLDTIMNYGYRRFENQGITLDTILNERGCPIKNIEELQLASGDFGFSDIKIIEDILHFSENLEQEWPSDKQKMETFKRIKFRMTLFAREIFDFIRKETAVFLGS